MILNVYWFPCKVIFILVRFSRKMNFSPKIFEIYSNIKFHEKIHTIGAELFYVDGRTDGHTDMTKLTVVFRNFCKNFQKQ